MIRLTAPFKTRHHRVDPRYIVCTAIGLLLLAACATQAPAPTQELQAAELAINRAEQVRVADYASTELSQARDKLAAANLAIQKEKMLDAKRLAEQAHVDAELAIAKTEAVQALAINADMKKSTENLKQEMQRNQGVTP